MRQLIQVDRSQLHKGEPEKTLTEGKKKTGGRNNKGRLTSGNKGGGHKKRHRLEARQKGRRRQNHPPRIRSEPYRVDCPR
jgi:ribosomal protein L2